MTIINRYLTAFYFYRQSHVSKNSTESLSLHKRRKMVYTGFMPHGSIILRSHLLIAGIVQ